MCRTVCTEPQCLYMGALYLYLTVELYLYSPYVPYGLYRASVLVHGCTLPLPYSRAIPLLPLCAVRPVQSLSACTWVNFTFTFTKWKTVIYLQDVETNSWMLLKCVSVRLYQTVSTWLRTLIYPNFITSESTLLIFSNYTHFISSSSSSSNRWQGVMSRDLSMSH
jgi:hypothetical protein